MLLDLLSIHSVKGLESELEVGDEGIATGLGEVLTDDNTHEFHLLGVRSHGVGRHDPAALAKLMGTIKLVMIPAQVRTAAKLTSQTRRIACQDPRRCDKRQEADLHHLSATK